MFVIRMSASASLLIVAVILARALFSNRLPRGTFLVLWGVCVCRLLLPIRIPSRFSVFSLLGRPGAAPFRFPMAGGQAPLPGIAENAGAAAGGKISVTVLVWLVGGLLLAGYLIGTHGKCRRVYRTALPIENQFLDAWQAENPTKRVVSIRRCDRVSSPLTYGLFRPMILLPKTLELQDTDTLRYVLAHEYAHIKRFDLAKKVLLLFCLCVHWFNPLVWVLVFLSSRDL